MNTIKLKTHIGHDGVLKVELPGVANAEAEVVIVYSIEEQVKEDWKTFVDRTYGILADDPIERPPELPIETREPIE